MATYHVRLDGNLWVTAFALVKARNKRDAVATASLLPNSELDWDLIDEDNRAQVPDEVTACSVVPAAEDWQHHG